MTSEIGDDAALGEELLAVLNAVRGLATPASRKYDRLKQVFAERIGADIAVCYLSDMSKMWTPRVGQSLLSRPDGLLLLSSDSFAQKTRDGTSYIEKLASIVAWAPRIEFAVACTGWEGDWTAESVTGPRDSLVCDLIARAFRTAACRRLDIEPIVRLPDPR